MLINKKNKNSYLILWRFFSRRRKSQLFGLCGLMILSALLEVVSIATVIPFLSLISNQNQSLSNKYIQKIANSLSIDDMQTIFVYVTIIFTVAIIISGAVRILNTYLVGKYSAIIGHELSSISFEKSLYNGLQEHMNLNTSELIATLTRHIDQTIVIIISILQIITSLINVIFIFIGLLFVNWKLAILASTGIIFSYLIIVGYSQNILKKNSYEMTRDAGLQFKELQEGYGSFREIVLENTQKLYLSRYASLDIKMRLRNAQSLFIRSFPRYAIEAISISIIIILGLILSFQENNNQNLLTSLGVLALAAQRILPYGQTTFQSWAYIKAHSSEFSKTMHLVDAPTYERDYNSKKYDLKNSIEFKNVDFAYQGSDVLVLKNINLKIIKGEKIGIVGTTGSGKSTFVDLLMSLLKPSAGKVLLDGNSLNSNHELTQAWRKSIAHVPQNIFLSDNSIAENIAFGKKIKEIDFELLEDCSKKAQLSSFINSLENGFYTRVGEKGVKLSGGQKQRIGIARALYKKKKILILDEATSALDVVTESKVIKAINTLCEDLTIIAVAHRTSTLQNYDRLIKFESGNLS